ncbi:hypothetical protein PPACK8108_LOCUS22894 [Phakopsora pachyrhizi]|uniref:Uncharacterized protein n=1 Tax=Phakopsora pachyrhizi TaxID=170000 RepID=A0AAV0BMX9_PHAPC|nr:hypothetical protein PPACK8108_LOCUS22894 [Phakopsora pachyrhizi]
MANLRSWVNPFDSSLESSGTQGSRSSTPGVTAQTPGETTLDVEATGFAMEERQTTTLGRVALGGLGGGARSTDVDGLAEFLPAIVVLYPPCGGLGGRLVDREVKLARGQYLLSSVSAVSPCLSLPPSSSSPSSLLELPIATVLRSAQVTSVKVEGLAFWRLACWVVLTSLARLNWDLAKCSEDPTWLLTIPSWLVHSPDKIGIPPVGIPAFFNTLLLPDWTPFDSSSESSGAQGSRSSTPGVTPQTPGKTTLEVKATGFADEGRQTTTLERVASGGLGGGAKSADFNGLAAFLPAIVALHSPCGGLGGRLVDQEVKSARGQ